MVHTDQREVDFLVLGSGIAGLFYALQVAHRGRVAIVTKKQAAESATNYAQGGIAGVMDPEDRIEDHVADTLVAGGGLCDADVVERVVGEAPRRIGELISWGCRFDEHHGSLVLGREGGHGRNRIVHALGDETGKEVMRTDDGSSNGVPSGDGEYQSRWAL